MSIKDINFSAGINHVLVIDTREYSGNFEREMAAYVIGADSQYHSEAGLAEFNEDAEENPKLLELQQLIVTQNHVEYDDVVATIWPTPGRNNNGMGYNTDGDPEKGKCPAYESVAIFVSRELTDDELALIRQRAETFGENYMSYRPQPFKIIDVRQLTVEVERKIKIKIR